MDGGQILQKRWTNIGQIFENTAYMLDKYCKQIEEKYWLNIGQIFDKKYFWDQRVRADDRNWLL